MPLSMKVKDRGDFVDELLGRQMPYSIEAEQSILGAMLIDSRCVADVIAAVKPEDFYAPTNRGIFETIYTMLPSYFRTFSLIY